MDIDQAWDITTGSNILVAILDSGVDLDHPDLQANIISSGWDAAEGDTIANDDNSGHGTAVAGLIAAVGDNNLGVAGIAYNADILPIRIFGDDGSSSSVGIGGAIDTAWMRGADILNNSWGGGSASDFIDSAFIRAKTLGRGGEGLCHFGCVRQW